MLSRFAFLARSIAAGLFAVSLLVGSVSMTAATAAAQDASPAATPAVAVVYERTITLLNVEGNVVGFARFHEENGEVKMTFTNSGNSGLTPGVHGIHIHETGSCVAAGETPFKTAGGHFNPTNAKHGAPEDPNSHAGDLGNFTVKPDGSFLFQITTSKVTLAPGQANSLDDADGSSLLIHDHADDLKTDPAGDSGGRIACGLIFQSQTPIAAPASPAASPEATPVS
jgi:Cu-Zn family superoxide dismutase